MKSIAPALKQQSMVGLSQSPEADTAVKPVGFWGRLVTRLRSWFEIPYGYEDEKGFHYGVEPASRAAARMTKTQKVHTDRASDVIPSPCPVSLDDVETTVDRH